MVEQQKIDIEEESTTTAVTKPNKKENERSSILETEKGKEQENAAEVEVEDIKEEK